MASVVLLNVIILVYKFRNRIIVFWKEFQVESWKLWWLVARETVPYEVHFHNDSLEDHPIPIPIEDKREAHSYYLYLAVTMNIGSNIFLVLPMLNKCNRKYSKVIHYLGNIIRFSHCSFYSLLESQCFLNVMISCCQLMTVTDPTRVG